MLHGGQPVWTVGPEPVQRGSGRGFASVACLPFDVFEAATFEPGGRSATSAPASMRSKAPGARSAPSNWFGRAGLPARWPFFEYPGDLGSVVTAELPFGPGPTRAGRRARASLARYEARGDGKIPTPLRGDERRGWGMAGWVVARDAAVGEHLVQGIMAGSVFQHCQRGRGPTAGAITVTLHGCCKQIT